MSMRAWSDARLAIFLTKENPLVVVAETEIKNFAPDLSQSILPALILRSRLAARLRALSPIKDIGKVDEVYFFLQSSIFGFVHNHLPPKDIGDLASPLEQSQKSIREVLWNTSGVPVRRRIFNFPKVFRAVKLHSQQP
jgi:hypothetical protein